MEGGIREEGLFENFFKQGLNGDSTKRGVKVPNLDSRMAKSPARVDLFLLLAYRFDISPNMYFMRGII